MRNLEGTKGAKGSKAVLREGQNREENLGQNEIQAGPTRPLAGNERGSFVARRERRTRPKTRVSQPSGESETSETSEVERPGTLTLKQVKALQYAYTSGIGSMEQVARIFGLSVSTVSKYCSGLEVTYPVDTPSASGNTPSTVVTNRVQGVAPAPPPSTNGVETARHSELEDSEEGGEPRMPRLAHEVSGVRPTVNVLTSDEENNGHLDIIEPVVPNHPLERLFSFAALYRGMTMEEFVREVVMPDLKSWGLVKSAVPGSTNEQVERNLIAMIEDALTFRRMIKNSREEAQKETEPNGESPN